MPPHRPATVLPRHRIEVPIRIALGGDWGQRRRTQLKSAPAISRVRWSHRLKCRHTGLLQFYLHWTASMAILNFRCGFLHFLYPPWGLCFIPTVQEPPKEITIVPNMWCCKQPPINRSSLPPLLPSLCLYIFTSFDLDSTFWFFGLLSFVFQFVAILGYTTPAWCPALIFFGIGPQGMLQLGISPAILFREAALGGILTRNPTTILNIVPFLIWFEDAYVADGGILEDL